MKVAIPCLYAIYGRYTDELRAIPYYLDCLKPVERRVLYALHKVARRKLTKSALVVGDTIGKYHPHGDQSTYESLVSLVQRQYAIGQGNWGGISLKKSKAAAYRYTEVKINELVDKIAFELIDFVEWGDPENLQFQQPIYLTTPVPIGLIGEGVISGISFNTTKVPRYSFIDLIERLQSLFQNELDPSKPLKTIIPNIPGCNVYELNPGDFEKILTEGEGSIIIQPQMSVDAHGVHVYGKPPTGTATWLKENEYYTVDDLSTGGKFEALFSPKKGAVTQQFCDGVNQIVTSKVHFNCNFVVKNGTVERKSIDSLLRLSYNTWVENLTKRYESEKHALIEKLFEFKVIAVVREIVNNYGANLSKVDDIIAIFEQNLKQKYSDVSSQNIREVCGKHTIRRLIEHKLDSHSTELQLQDVENTIKNIVSVAYNKMLGYIGK